VFVALKTRIGVSLPLVGADSATEHNHFSDCVPQRNSVRISDDFNANATNASLSFVFNGNENENLACRTSTTFPWLNSAKKYLVNFHESTEKFSASKHHGGADFPE
jgi:hypothetical protein